MTKNDCLEILATSWLNSNILNLTEKQWAIFASLDELMVLVKMLDYPLSKDIKTYIITSLKDLVRTIPLTQAKIEIEDAHGMPDEEKILLNRNLITFYLKVQLLEE